MAANRRNHARGGLDSGWHRGNVATLGSAVRTRNVRTTLSMPATLHVALTVTDGVDRNGTRLDVQGGLLLPGLSVDLVFQRRFMRSHAEADATSRAVLVPSGEYLEFEGQRFVSPVGGDAVAWISIRDDQGNPVTAECYLGRLPQGTCELSPSFTTLIVAETSICPFTCGTLGESDLTLTGEIRFAAGISARIALRRREGPLWWRRPPDGVFDFSVAPSGQRIQFPAQAVWGGDPGDTLKSLVFLGPDGDPMGDEHPLESPASMQ